MKFERVLWMNGSGRCDIQFVQERGEVVVFIVAHNNKMTKILRDNFLKRYSDFKAPRTRYFYTMNAEEKDLDLNFESLEDRSRFTEILEKRFDEEDDISLYPPIENDRKNTQLTHKPRFSIANTTPQTQTSPLYQPKNRSKHKKMSFSYSGNSTRDSNNSTKQISSNSRDEKKKINVLQKKESSSLSSSSSHKPAHISSFSKHAQSTLGSSDTKMQYKKRRPPIFTPKIPSKNHTETNWEDFSVPPNLIVNSLDKKKRDDGDVCYIPSSGESDNESKAPINLVLDGEYSDSENILESLSSEDSSRAGFMNLGNTCYMNAVMEALSSIVCFRNDVCALRILEFLPEDALLVSIRNIMLEREVNQKKPLDLTPVKAAVAESNECFQGYAQQDAHEFLCACFHQLENELDPFISESKFEYSITKKDVPTTRNFSGILENVLTCGNCGHKETSYENFYFLNTSIPENVDKVYTISELLNLYFSEEEFEKNCVYCTSKVAKRKYRISSLPRVLIIQVQRFKYNITTNSLSKVTKRVKPCQSIVLKPFCYEETHNPHWFGKTQNLLGKRLKDESDNHFSPKKKQKISFDSSLVTSMSGDLVKTENIEPDYKLHAVITHNGTPQSGHYTCNISKEKKWEHCNDSIVSSISLEEGDKAAEKGYIFFYVHKNIVKQLK